MSIWDLLFPKRCVGCNRIGTYVCHVCKQNVHYITQSEAICPMCGRRALDGATHPVCMSPTSINGLTSFFRYDSVIRKAIKTIKYRGITDVASAIVGLAPQGALDDIKNLRPNPSICIPIPLHTTRFKERGFNQSALLGGLLARQMAIPVNENLLVRSRSTSHQASMPSKVARLKNVSHAFAISSTKLPSGSVLLFDDVFTTGATMRQAASTLKKGGATFVWAVTIAR